MIKVIIADDELKVCKLIEFLVDWEALGMEVAAIVHNGLEALEAVETHHPGIIITDIKMPGCDGLELIERSRELTPDLDYIVISGYREFDYARKAIQFGVSNYLLKPIDKEELTHTLKKVKKHHNWRAEQMQNSERLESFEQKDKERLRSQIFEDILFKKNLPETKITMDGLNEKYSFGFREGCFQTAAIKVDGIHEQTERNRDYIENKIIRQLQKNLDRCFEWAFQFEQGICFLLLNYDEQINIREIMSRILQNLLQQQDVIRGIQVTIGLGEEERSPEVFAKGLKVAKWALDQRLLAGTNRLIQGEDKNANTFARSSLFQDFNKAFCDAIELQNTASVKETVGQLEKRLAGRKETTGYEILQICKEAVNAYLFIIRKLELPVTGLDNLQEQFNMEIHNCGTAQETFRYLERTVCRSLEQIVKEKEQQDTKPIRMAKKYIAEHLSEPISLELVSEAVGFNTAYFSTLFKNGTGTTFSEYLLSKRLEKAKEFLRETNISVADICEAVGYSDVKHFTKNFTKYTSLKPKEYRKLYS